MSLQSLLFPIVIIHVFTEQYIEKSLIIKETEPGNPSLAMRIWQAVQAINIQEVYRLIVTSDQTLVNTKYEDAVHHADVEYSDFGCKTTENQKAEACMRSEFPSNPVSCLHGCSLLHLACHSNSALMVELLLQFGADVNMRDYHGRTPLHHCISSGKNPLAKFLLRR